MNRTNQWSFSAPLLSGVLMGLFLVASPGCRSEKPESTTLEVDAKGDPASLSSEVPDTTDPLSAVPASANTGRGDGASNRLRIATFNIALNRRTADQLRQELARGDDRKISRVAEVIQLVAPDILVINELDRAEENLPLFQENFLEVSQNGQAPIKYAYVFTAPVNTGEPSGMDLNRDGQIEGPDDAYGFGAFPGQYSMAVLSKFPIQRDEVRTFQKFLWRDLPEMQWPLLEGQPYYNEAVRQRFRLSSKSHWDVPIAVQGLQGNLHVLASHPTPPVFDGAEDRNGLRNADEIRFWSLYIHGNKALVDDQGATGGLADGQHFVIAGDLNADPMDGDGIHQTIQNLLDDPRVNSDNPPASAGAAEASRQSGGQNESHAGPAHFDTADFNDQSVGNLRVDYVLPSATLTVSDSGVFWPGGDDPHAKLADASDHHLVWIDIELSE